MTNQQLDLLLNEMFFNFENNLFVNEGNWPRKINLIFAFADYIDELQDDDLAQKLRSSNKKLINRLRKRAKDGISQWLEENMKTLMF